MTKEHPDSLSRSPDNIRGSHDSTLSHQDGMDTPQHVLLELLQPAALRCGDTET